MIIQNPHTAFHSQLIRLHKIPIYIYNVFIDHRKSLIRIGGVIEFSHNMSSYSSVANVDAAKEGHREYHDVTSNQFLRNRSYKKCCFGNGNSSSEGGVQGREIKKKLAEEESLHKVMYLSCWTQC